MVILNATRSVKSLISDSGSLITIKPGQLSQVMIASRNLIISAMKLGEPDQIGIIISGSYEMDISKTITGAIPYLYTNVNEAKNKLLDPNINYEEGSVATNLNAELAKKNQEIEKLKEELQSKKSTNENSKSNALVTEFNTLQSKYNSLMSERNALEDAKKKATKEIEDLNNKLNDLRNSNGSLTQELSAVNTNYSKILEEKKKLEDEIELYKNNESNSNNTEVSSLNQDLSKANEEIGRLSSELESKAKELDSLNKKLSGLEANDKAWQKISDDKDEEIEQYKTSLKEATETIENMKNEFNTACQKFKITKDENGDWIQITEDVR